MQFQSPSDVQAVPGVTAPTTPVDGEGDGDGVGVGVAMGDGVLSAGLPAMGSVMTDEGVGDAATGAAEDATGSGTTVAGAAMGEGVGVGVDVTSANAPPGTVASAVGVGAGAAVVAIVTETGAGSGMLPTVPLRDATVLGSQELGPVLQPVRRFAMSDA